MRCDLNCRGLTLLETVMVLIIAGLIVGAVWVAYARADLNSRVQRTVSATTKTETAVRDYLATQSSVPANIAYALYNQGLMPTELSFVSTDGSTTAVFNSPLGGNFQIVIPATPNAFEIDVAYPDANACVQFVPQIVGNSRLITDQGIIQYTVGSTTTAAPNVLPNVATACAAAPFVAQFVFAMRP